MPWAIFASRTAHCPHGAGSARLPWHRIGAKDYHHAPLKGSADREALIEELRAEREAATKAAADAAQEAEVEAWLEAKRAAEAEEKRDLPNPF